MDAIILATLNRTHGSNIADVYQYGSEHSSDIQQQGSYNEAFLDQDGTGHEKHYSAI